MVKQTAKLSMFLKSQELQLILQGLRLCSTELESCSTLWKAGSILALIF